MRFGGSMTKKAKEKAQQLKGQDIIAILKETKGNPWEILIVLLLCRNKELSWGLLALALIFPAKVAELESLLWNYLVSLIK